MNEQKLRREYWQQQLDAFESSTPTPDTRASWLRRIYIRLYRFLLSHYGHDRHESLSESLSPSNVTAYMPEEPLLGKPAKSLGEIRTTLKNIHNAQPEPHRPQVDATYVHGLRPESWIVVATEKRSMSLDRCCVVLRECGVEHRINGNAIVRQLEVRYRAFDKALQLLNDAKPLLGFPLGAKAYAARHQTVVAVACVLMLLAIPLWALVVVVLRSGVTWEQAAINTLSLMGIVAGAAAITFALKNGIQEGWNRRRVKRRRSTHRG